MWLDTLFPWTCLACAGPATARDLCDGCHADLPWRKDPGAGSVLAPLHYAFPVDQMLLKLKFGQRLVVGRVLGEVMGEFLVARSTGPRLRIDAVVPVPLHAKRLRERGYNQALELTRPMAKRLSVPVWDDVCRRVRHTEAQSTLTGLARVGNVRGAFVADAKVAGKSVAVLDDIHTTGSTMEAVAAALYGAGADRVQLCAIAKA